MFQLVRQKLDLLAKEGVLLRDRQQLARHVEFLQHQLLAGQTTDDTVRDKVNVYLGSRLATDDVLTQVYEELQRHDQQKIEERLHEHSNDDEDRDNRVKQ